LWGTPPPPPPAPRRWHQGGLTAAPGYAVDASTGSPTATAGEELMRTRLLHRTALIAQPADRLKDSR